MIELIALIVSVAAAALAVASLVVAWRQLRIARADSGGHGLIVRAPYPGHEIVTGPAGAQMRHRKVSVIVTAAGPGVWHSLRLYVGDPETSVQHANRFDSESDPLEWHGLIPSVELADTWWMVTWLKPYLDGNRTEAFRKNIGDQNSPVERWEWKRPYRFHHWFQSEPRWWLPRSGQHKPLGRWKSRPPRHPGDGQGPDIPEAHVQPYN